MLRPHASRREPSEARHETLLTTREPRASPPTPVDAVLSPRVQVTVDPEFAAATAAVDPHPGSRSRLMRDLAIRGAEAERTRASAGTTQSTIC
jgi:hypothetical protein